MSSKPRVSVIIPAFNAAATLEEAVQSCLAQSMADLEVLVIDDGSSDKTADVARTLQRQDSARVRVLSHPNLENRGVAAARNLGIAHAEGVFLAFLDADDAWLPQKLEKQLGVFVANPQIGLVFSDVYLCIDPDPKQYMYEQPLEVDPIRKNMAAIINGDRLGAARALNLHERPWSYVPSPTPLMRQELLGESVRFVGPPRLHLQYEDFLMWRVLAMRAAFHYVEEPLAIYRVHTQSFTGKFKRKRTSVDHLRGVEEVQREFFAVCGDQVARLGWGEEIRKIYRQHIQKTVNRTSFRQLNILLGLALREGCFLKVLAGLAHREMLRVKYLAYDTVRFLRKKFAQGKG